MPQEEGKYSQIQFAYLVYFKVVKKNTGCREGENAHCQKTDLKSLHIDGWFLKLATHCLHLRFDRWRKATRNDDIRPIVVLNISSSIVTFWLDRHGKTPFHLGNSSDLSITYWLEITYTFVFNKIARLLPSTVCELGEILYDFGFSLGRERNKPLGKA